MITTSFILNIVWGVISIAVSFEGTPTGPKAFSFILGLVVLAFGITGLVIL